MVAKVAADAIIATSVKLFGGQWKDSNIPSTAHKQFVDHLQGVGLLSSGDTVAYMLLTLR